MLQYAKDSEFLSQKFDDDFSADDAFLEIRPSDDDDMKLYKTRKKEEAKKGKKKLFGPTRAKKGYKKNAKVESTSVFCVTCDKKFGNRNFLIAHLHKILQLLNLIFNFVKE